MLIISEIEKLIQQQMVKFTGLDGTHIRGSNAFDNPPKFQKGENYVYYQLNPADDPISRQMDIEYTNVDDEKAEKNISYNRVLELNLTVYGPLSFEYTRLIKIGFMDKSANTVLRKNQVFPIPDIAEGNRITELYNNNWINRSDMKVRFNMLATDQGITTTKEPVYYLKGAGITLETEKEDREIKIEEE